MEEKTTLKWPWSADLLYAPIFPTRKSHSNQLVVRTAIRSLMTHDPSSISKNWASNSDTASHRTNPQLVCFFQQGPSKLCNRLEDVWSLTLLRVLSKRILWRSFLQILHGKFWQLQISEMFFPSLNHNMLWCSKSRNATAEPTLRLHSILPIYKAFKNFLFGRAVSKASRKKKHMFFSQIFRLETIGKIGHNFPPGAKAPVWRVWWMQRRWRLRKARQPPDSALVLASGPSSTWNDPRSSMRTWKRVKVKVCLLGEAEKLKDTPRNPPYGNWGGRQNNVLGKGNPVTHSVKKSDSLTFGQGSQAAFAVQRPPGWFANWHRSTRSRVAHAAASRNGNTSPHCVLVFLRNIGCSFTN